MNFWLIEVYRSCISKVSLTGWLTPFVLCSRCVCDVQWSISASTCFLSVFVVAVMGLINPPPPTHTPPSPSFWAPAGRVCCPSRMDFHGKTEPRRCCLPSLWRHGGRGSTRVAGRVWPAHTAQSNLLWMVKEVCRCCCEEEGEQADTEDCKESKGGCRLFVFFFSLALLILKASVIRMRETESMLPDLRQQGPCWDGLLADEVASGRAEGRWRARSSTSLSVWETLKQFGARKQQEACDHEDGLNPTARHREEEKIYKEEDRLVAGLF